MKKEEINKVHCLFEQSGTFKNEFKKMGIVAEDYDIQNEFGETDHVVDLFAEIEGGVEGKPSIFDNFNENDLVFAFFPCIRFSENFLMQMRLSAFQYKDYSILRKLKTSVKFAKEQADFYTLWCKLFYIAYIRNLKMIVENPKGTYLTSSFPIKPSVVDLNRRLMGDNFQKPTMYYFVNLEPLDNPVDVEYNDANNTINEVIQMYNKSNRIERSMINPNYARAFIERYILDKGEFETSVITLF